jgi:response regulator of citrate/malate metabolism
MITADTDKWIEEKAMDEGINYFLQKPITRNNIDVALDKLNVKRS